MSQSQWFVYILECSDQTLYTGITTDVQRRIQQHESGQGAKYTRNRSPVKLLYTEKKPDRSQASKRELAIKSLSKIEKLNLIASAA